VKGGKTKDPEAAGIEKTVHHFEGVWVDVGIEKSFIDHPGSLPPRCKTYRGRRCAANHGSRGALNS